MHISKPIAVLALVLTSASHSAEPVDRFCTSVSRNIDTLASSFRTSCLPTGGGKPGVHSALLIASAPVFGNEKSKKAFLILACVAAGSELNNNARLRMNELWFSDVERTKQRVAFVGPAAECKALQPQVHSGTMSLEQLYARLESKLVRRNVAN